MVDTDDAYVQADNTLIAPRVSGYISEVLVADNQAVKAGQVLARIDDRDYQTALEFYNDLLKKESESQMATSMEQMQQGERFTMQDPPNYPLKPDFPNHLKFCGIGVAVGLLLGIALVGVLEYVDDRMHLGEEIKEMMPVAVISEVPEIVTPADVRASRRRVALGWATAAVVLITILAGTALSFLRS